MTYQEAIDKAVNNLVNEHRASIVRHYDGYIILAHNERDYQTKVSKIQRGDIKGFCTIERALNRPQTFNTKEK